MMCRSIYAPLLVVLSLCVMNGLSCSNPNSESSSDMNRVSTPTHYEQPQSSEIDINILAISFQNGMAPNNKNVNLYYNNQKDGVYLSPGQGFVKLDNTNGPKPAVMYWNGNCISFLAYDPKSEGNNEKIFWLVKEDGVYHSLDNKSWQKRKGWTFNHC
ncbi:unnamed protein product [Sphenostylis stenocarpa]|uniref:Uncharacterized protein n=1 Tax=Sphenostylis stenocarpa TaxID=92480 RepID=A0AA86T8T9_9FABA|nr:unnamed protein product [Sphenostylis stenocarpa]